jgi:hypothetical protein
MNAKNEQSSGKKALADALLELDGRTETSTAEGKAIAGRVLRRDRLRVRLLTGMTIALFLLAAVGIYRSFSMAKNDIYSKIFECSDQIFARDMTGGELKILRLVQEAYMIQFHIVLMDSVAFAAILLAAVLTVLLVLAARRATLRQIQSSLLTLSKQIETMRTQQGHP